MAQPNRQHIESLRVEAGLKRTPFAERCGISYNHLYGIERGEHVAARETLAVIARELTALLDRPVALKEVIAEDAPDPSPAAEAEAEAAGPAEAAQATAAAQASRGAA